MQEKSENITRIKQKILYFIDTQTIKKEDFYKKVGIDGANFRGKNLKSELSADKIVNILRKYSEISPDWLLLDKGEMLRSESDERPDGSGSATEIELLRAAIRDKETIIESQNKNIELLEEKVEFLEERLAHCEDMASGAVAG